MEVECHLTCEQQQVVLDNIGLVYHVFNRKFTRYMDWRDDLIQEGKMALMRSAVGFKYDSEFKFSTYAYRAIHIGMINYINRFIKMALNIPSKDRMLYSKFQSLIKEGHSEEYVCKQLNCNISDIKALELARNPCSVNIRIGREENKELLECLPDHESLEDTIIGKVTSKEVVDLFKLVYEEDHLLLEIFDLCRTGINNADIGRKLGYSRERIRQIRGRVENGVRRVIKLYNSEGYEKVKYINRNGLNKSRIRQLLIKENIDEILEGHDELVDRAKEWVKKNKGERLILKKISEEHGLEYPKYDLVDFKYALYYKLRSEGFNVNLVGGRNDIVLYK